MTRILAKSILLSTILGVSGAIATGPALAQMQSDSMMESDAMMESEGSVMVGGAAMLPERNIVENAVNSADHTTLVAAVKAAGLVETLSGPGPFTVFAPTNDAFGDLPAGTVDTLLMEENKDQLTKVLTAHVVPGDYSAADLMEMVENSDTGAIALTAVSGDTIGVQMLAGNLVAFDESRNVSRITIPDVNQSNGVIHVVDSVLVPE